MGTRSPGPPEPLPRNSDLPLSRIIAEAFALRRECRDDYELTLYSQYVRAEASTNGSLLNERGRERDIDALTLFMGPEVRARAYASAELIEHWESHPRVTFAQFERRWMAEREAEMIGAAA